MKQIMLVALAAVSSVAFAQTVVNIEGAGAEKLSVSVSVGSGQYATILRKNLELSGRFKVDPNGSIRVTGTPGGSVAAEGAGKRITASAAFTDAKGERMAARRFSDEICKAFGEQEGFATKPIAFVSRRGKGVSELCVTYPDGYDIQQITSDGQGVVGPRWKDANTLYYTFLKTGSQIYEYDLNTRRRRQCWDIRGTTTGAVVSPDGRRVAVILSAFGNPELCVIEGKTLTRLTRTPGASEGQPSWSPDGKKIVYVSDETRHPQLYVIDVATKQKRRLTSRGTQNMDPDWGRDGRICYTTKRGGQSIVAVLQPAAGDASAELVTGPGTWEHPSWAPDRRHVVAGRDKALFLVDTMKDGDAPRQMFRANGVWTMPSWSR